MRCGLLLCCWLLGGWALGADPTVVDLWAGKPPGETADVGSEKENPPPADEKPPTKRVTNVSKPTLTIFRPTPDKDTGAAIIIAPGGGYNILAFDKEGEEVAQWLNTIGVTGIVLKYRVPRRADQPKDQAPSVALMDAQRAISLVRSRASEWKLDPKRIGMLGFSAGGHLTAWTATNFDKRRYDATDKVDEASCRPDFAVLVYPAYLTQKDSLTLATDIRVSKETPPIFFAHAGDDRVKAENSVAMYLELRKVNVPSELHIYTSGGHGFGLRPGGKPVLTWPQRCADWLGERGLLKASKK